MRDDGADVRTTLEIDDDVPTIPFSALNGAVKSTLIVTTDSGTT